MAITKPGIKLSDLDVERVDGVDKPATKSKFFLMKSEDAAELRQNIEKTADAGDVLLDLIEKDANVSPEIKAAAASLGAALGRTEKAAPDNEADCTAAGGTWADGACTFPSAKAAEPTACTKCKAPVAKGQFVAKDGEVRKGDTCPMCGAPVDGDGNYAPTADTEKAAEKTEAKKEAATTATATEIAAEVAKALSPVLTKLAESNASIAKAIEGAPKAIAKTAAPASRQATGDDEAKPVEKAMGKGLFSDIVFGQR